VKPIIFLDIDGVLATPRSIHGSRGNWKFAGAERYPYGFAPDAVANLNALTDRTKAQIVVSSTWRRGHSVAGLRAILKAEGVQGIVLDKTPYLPDAARGEEIQWWLDNSHRYDGQPFVILDDDTDMVHLMPRLVQTSFMDGLTRKRAKWALDLLQREPVT
jgi:hypothetical protein